MSEWVGGCQEAAKAVGSGYFGVVVDVRASLLQSGDYYQHRAAECPAEEAREGGGGGGRKRERGREGKREGGCVAGTSSHGARSTL